MYPLEAVQSMVKTIQVIERNADIYNKHYELDEDSETYHNEAVILAACTLAELVNAKAIIGTSRSGYTAFRTAAHRPDADIFIFTNKKDILTSLNLIWGVQAFYYDHFKNTDTTVESLIQILKDGGYLQKGDVVINTGSMPVEDNNMTNMVKLSVVS